MAKLPQFFQVSLRTVFELTFVVAVVLAFFYWRNVPREQAGRYQIVPLSESRVLFIDTQTGKAWRGYPNSTHWTPIATPVGKK